MRAPVRRGSRPCGCLGLELLLERTGLGLGVFVASLSPGLGLGLGVGAGLDGELGGDLKKKLELSYRIMIYVATTDF